MPFTKRSSSFLVNSCGLTALLILPASFALADEPQQKAASPKIAASTKATAGQKLDSSAARLPVEARRPVKRRLVTISGNRTTLDVRQWPLLGNPDAKYVFVEMFDYTCPHCQATHQALLGAMQQYGSDLAVIALPVPLDSSCNHAAPENNSFHTDSCETTRISIALWRVNPKQFEHFHSWMFQTRRSAAEARQYAGQLVGQEALNKELSQQWAGKYLAKHIELYQRAGGGSVPKLLFPKSTLTGEVNNTATLVSIIERELGQ